MIGLILFAPGYAGMDAQQQQQDNENPETIRQVLFEESAIDLSLYQGSQHGRADAHRHPAQLLAIYRSSSMNMEKDARKEPVEEGQYGGKGQQSKDAHADPDVQEGV